VFRVAEQVGKEKQRIAGRRDLLADDWHCRGEARRPSGVAFAHQPLHPGGQPAAVSRRAQLGGAQHQFSITRGVDAGGEPRVKRPMHPANPDAKRLVQGEACDPLCEPRRNYLGSLCGCHGSGSLIDDETADQTSRHSLSSD
jgi:hypothetical protein